MSGMLKRLRFLFGSVSSVVSCLLSGVFTTDCSAVVVGTTGCRLFLFVLMLFRLTQAVVILLRFFQIFVHAWCPKFEIASLISFSKAAYVFDC